MPAKPRVCSVTVAFNPPADRLERQVAALRQQVDAIILVDNGSDAAARARVQRLGSSGDGKTHLIELAANEGVGAGLNHGIAAAEGLGCDYVLLLDHDSVPTAGMVTALLSGHEEATAGGTRPIAAVGPRILDSRDGHEYPFMRLGWTHNPRIRCGGDSGIVTCDFLISSGSLVSAEALRRIGGFDETLFIEYVDLDWCCRARALGYSFYGVCSASLDHELGEEPRQVLGGLRILVHSPERMYYATRNRLLLYRRGHVPLKWKVKDVARGALKVATALLFVAPRRRYFRMARLAVRDALAGRGGGLPATSEETRA